MISVVEDTYENTPFFMVNCISECYIKKAQKHCGCTPWDYPPIPESGRDDKHTKICDLFGHSCFEVLFRLDLLKNVKNAVTLVVMSLSIQYLLKKRP